MQKNGYIMYLLNITRASLLVFFMLLKFASDAQVMPPPAFQETFEDNKNNWSVFERRFARSIVSEGKLLMDVTDEDAGFFTQKHQVIYPDKDFVIEAILEINNFRNGSFGLVWGADEYSNYQAMDFSHNGFFHAYIFKKRRVIPIQRPNFMPTPLAEGKKLSLVIRKSADQISFELDDKILGTATFTPFHGTYVGFHLRGRISVKVSDFNIYQEPVAIRHVAGSFVDCEKENLGPNINSEFSEKGVVVSPDGTTLYVARGEHPLNSGTMKKDDIWYAQKDSLGSWEELKNIGPPLNNSGNNFVISVAPDGNTLLVANTYLPDGRSLGGGVSIARRSNEGWKMPENQVIEDYYNEADFVDYCLSPNQKVLLMALERKDTKGDMDLYCSFLKEDNTWTAPLHLGPVINSFAMDFSPFIASDNETLYFSSYGHPGYGSADIFVSRRLDDSWTSWSQPENLGPDINSSTWEANYTLDARGEYAYLATVEKSMGKSDIFRIPLPASARPKPVVLISGNVLDASSGQPIEAEIKYFALATNEESGIATSHPVTGRYTIILPAGKHYGFHAEKGGFYPESANINTMDVNQFTEIEQNLLLSPVSVGASLTLNNIFFETNEAALQKESYAELDRVIRLLEAHPEMEIEVAGHTDNTGSPVYNQQLSLERSEAVFEYLEEKGFTSRGHAVGYGSTKPRGDNNTEEGRQQNRRVEIIIKKM